MLNRYTFTLTKKELDTIIMALEDSERYKQGVRRRWYNNWSIRTSAERDIDNIRDLEKVLVEMLRPVPPCGDADLLPEYGPL